MSSEVVEGLDLSVLGRQGWEVEEAVRDVEVLVWVERFRFVTAQAAAERFGVSEQRANARFRRLGRLGLLGAARTHATQPRAVFVTGRGCELLGLPRRRPPRAEVQREHEAAIVWLATRLEPEPVVERVLTERECRRVEGAGEARLSIALAGAGAHRRWPDLVVERTGGARQAVEIEFTAKAPARLQAIVRGYQAAGTGYDSVVFYVRSARLGAQLERLATRRPSQLESLLGVAATSPLVRVEHWPRSDHLPAGLVGP